MTFFKSTINVLHSFAAITVDETHLCTSLDPANLNTLVVTETWDLHVSTRPEKIKQQKVKRHVLLVNRAKGQFCFGRKIPPNITYGIFWDVARKNEQIQLDAEVLKSIHLTAKSSVNPYINSSVTVLTVTYTLIILHLSYIC